MRIALASSLVASHAYMLRANMGAYPGTDPAEVGTVGGTVEVAMDGDSLKLDYELTGLEANVASGLHIHVGTTCDGSSAVGGHYWGDLNQTDPWTTKYETSNADGMSSGSLTVDAMLALDDVVGRTVVVHMENAAIKSSCGVIEKYFPPAVTYSTYVVGLPDYNGDESIEGDVQVSGVGNDLTVAFVLNGLAANASNGVHIHVGTSCENSDGTGKHYWGTEDKNDDPWNSMTGYTSDEDGSANDKFDINADVDIASALGKVIVIHDSTGTKAACGVLAPETWIVMGQSYEAMWGTLSGAMAYDATTKTYKWETTVDEDMYDLKPAQSIMQTDPSVEVTLDYADGDNAMVLAFAGSVVTVSEDRTFVFSVAAPTNTMYLMGTLTSWTCSDDTTKAATAMEKVDDTYEKEIKNVMPGSYEFKINAFDDCVNDEMWLTMEKNGRTYQNGTPYKIDVTENSDVVIQFTINTDGTYTVEADVTKAEPEGESTGSSTGSATGSSTGSSTGSATGVVNPCAPCEEAAICYSEGALALHTGGATFQTGEWCTPYGSCNGNATANAHMCAVCYPDAMFPNVTKGCPTATADPTEPPAPEPTAAEISSALGVAAPLAALVAIFAALV